MVVYTAQLWVRLRTLTRQPHWWAEVWSAFGLTGWALVNLTSPDRLSHKAFGPLLHLASENFLEHLALAVGLFQILALIIDNRWLRATSACLAASLVGSVVFNMLLGGYWPPGSVALYMQNTGLNLTAMVKNIRGEDGAT
jgi:hypothetical protein